jgi:proteasome lid subunit RPN8/RPN11
MAKPDGDLGPEVVLDSATIQQIRRHARSSMEAEICGVLVGTVTDGVTRVQACIAGENADQGGAHVTFTQETWQHIFRIKDAQFADSSIVGWYHSHPGFGIFLSDYDMFIHKNFFAAPHQIAWVFDPHSDSEGCFGWVSPESLGRVSRWIVEDSLRICDIAKPAGQAQIDRNTVIPFKDRTKHFLNQARRALGAVARALVAHLSSAKRMAEPHQRMPKPSERERESHNTSTATEDAAEKASSPPSTLRSQQKGDNTKGD